MQSVEKWSMTIHRLFSKDPNDEEENVTQNIYVFRFILFCIIVYSFEMLLNSVDIFIVDKTIFTRGYVTGCLFAADRKSTRLNSSHNRESRMPSSA